MEGNIIGKNPKGHWWCIYSLPRFLPLLLKDKMKQLNDLKHLWYKNTFFSTGFTNIIENTAILLQVIPSVVSATEQGQCKAPVTLVITCITITVNCITVSYIQKCILSSGLISCEKQDCFNHLNRKTWKAHGNRVLS